MRRNRVGQAVDLAARRLMLDPVISDARLQQMQAAGLWGDDLIVDHFDRNATRFPDRVAVVALAMESQRETRLTFGDLKRLSDRMLRVLRVLRDRGIGPGDVVAVQLPSWWHYLVIYPACARIGAAINPLMPIFRQRELRFMLGFAKTKLLIVADRFRGFDYPAMIEEIRPDLPNLKHVLVVGGDDPANDLERLLADDPPGGCGGRFRAAPFGQRRDRADVYLRHHGSAEGRHAHTQYPVVQGAAGAGAVSPDRR
ncbi:MAG: AMP-binding protein [Minwuia sp.]|nr:AMP-binding protein [Minwuia sp.]